MIGFDRKGFGKYQKHDSIYSVFHATDAFLLEDELNESQWERIEQIASFIRSQLKSGFVDKFTINAANYTNFFAIEGTNGNNPISVLIDGYQLKVGANQIVGQPSGLVSADNRLIIELSSVGSTTRTDLVLLETWFEVIDKDEIIYKFGGVDTPALNNEILDDRMDIETSRRIQFRWRLRTVDGTSSMTGIKALKYNGVDSGVVYSALGNIYVANVGEYHLPNGSLKATGDIYAMPLFTVTRNATNVVTLANITDISAKATPADGVMKDFMTNPANIVENANKRFVTDADKAKWDAAETNSKSYIDSKVNRVDLNQNITYGSNLINADDNGSELESTVYGRTLFNILGDFGSGESLNGWTTMGTTAPVISTTQKKSGTSSFKMVSGATGGSYLMRDVYFPLESTKQYIVGCWVYIESRTGGTPGFILYDVGTNNQRYIASANTSNIGNWQFVYLKIPQNSTFVGSGFRMILGYGSSGASTVYYDEVSIYELTNSEYTAIGTTITGSAINDYLPYVSAKKHVNGVAITKLGKNIYTGGIANPGVTTYVENSQNTITVTSDAAAYRYVTTKRYSVLPNTNYTLSYTATVVSGADSCSISVRKGSDNGVTALGGVSSAGNGFKSGTFNTGSETEIILYIYASIATAAAQIKKYENIQLELGTTATSFVAPMQNTAILPFTLGEVGGVKDKAYSQGANWIYQENVKKDVPITGQNIDMPVALSVPGYRSVVIKAFNDMQVGDFSYRMIKYDNTMLKNVNSDSSASLAAPDQTLQYGPDKTLRISIKNSEVGWTDAINPSIASIMAALNGWKAVSNDGSYYTWWTSMVDGVEPSPNTEQFVANNKAPGWNGWATIDYALEKPSMPLVINNAEGAISLHPGKNLINVESGVIQREKVTLVYNSTDLVYELNRPDGIYAPSKTTKKVARFINLYEDADIVSPASYSVYYGSSNVDNGLRISIPTSSFKANKTYYVSYVVMDKSTVTTNLLEGNVQFKTGLSGVVSDTVKSIDELRTENDSQDFADDYIEAKVDNLKVDFDTHNADSTRHITSTERTTWNAKETTTGAQTKATEALNSAKTYADTQLLLKSDKATTYTKTETDAKIQALIGAAPAALDTLKEIGDALNNDPNFAATMTTQLSNKVDKVTGKQLSTEDFTTAEKNKLSGLTTGAGGANSATDTVIGDRTVSDATAPSGNTGKLTAILGWFANRIKAITGKSSWITDPAINLEQTKAHVDNTTVHITSSERTSWNTAEANAKAASIPLTQKGTASGVASLDANSNIIATGERLNSSYSKRAFLLSFTAVANQKIDLYWTESPHGMFKINIGGAYSGNDAIGGITKEFNVVLSPPSTVNSGTGFYTKADGKLPNYISISDISYDSTNSRYKISIEHRASVINTYSMTVESWTSVRDVNFNISSVYVGTATALPVAVQTIADNTVTQSGYEIQKHSLTGNTGLGKGGVITVNANTLTGTGYYTLNLASTNIPISGNTTTIQVEQLDSSYISQEANVYSTVNTITVIRKFSRESRNGGTSWSAWREFSMKATIINSNADLNTFLTEGEYYCSSNASAATITNKPSYGDWAFNLQVRTTVGTEGTSCNQTIIYYRTSSDSPKIFTRNYYSSVWTSWQEIETTAMKNVANGYAGLDANADVLIDNLPDTIQRSKLTDVAGFAIKLANGTDLNTIVKNGFYDGYALANAPTSGNNWYYVEVQQHSGGDTYVLQKASLLSGSGGDLPISYQRVKKQGTWSTWTEIEGSNKKNVANGYAGLDANSRVLDSNKLEGYTSDKLLNTYTWSTPVKVKQWNRILQYNAAAGDITGTSFIINIAGTRGSHVYNSTFMVNTSHSFSGSVVQLDSNAYSMFRIRLVVDVNGNGFLEWNDDFTVDAAGTAQTLTCSLTKLRMSGTYTGILTQTNGSVPANYAAVSERASVQGAVISADGFVSTASTAAGPPLVVASTARVDNLNAEMISGTKLSNLGINIKYWDFGGNSNEITTAQFLVLLEQLGAFTSGHWVARGGWAFALNQIISDSGLGKIQLAGATVEVIGSQKDLCTVRITTPPQNTMVSGPNTTWSEFIYVSHPSGYVSGWRKGWNSANMGSGSGLDADTVRGFTTDQNLRTSDSPNFKSVKVSSKLEFQYNSTENSLDIVFL